MISLGRRVAGGWRQRKRLRAAWQTLPAADRRATRHLAVLVPLFAAALHTIGLRRTRAWVDALIRQPAATSSTREDVPRLVDALKRTARFAPYRGNCLSQSMALAFLLQRRGVPVDLRLGVRLEDGHVVAHAWVESRGETLNDTPDVRERFSTFGSVPAAPPAAPSS